MSSVHPTHDPHCATCLAFDMAERIVALKATIARLEAESGREVAHETRLPIPR